MRVSLQQEKNVQGHISVQLQNQTAFTTAAATAINLRLLRSLEQPVSVGVCGQNFLMLWKEQIWGKLQTLVPPVCYSAFHHGEVS